MARLVHRSSNQHRGDAFTLVELLVVISILALLISLLLPSLGKAKAQARLVQCKSNQRQLGYAYASYAGDHREQVPATRSYDNGEVVNGWSLAWGSRYMIWAAYLWPYANRSIDVFIDPAHDFKKFVGTVTSEPAVTGAEPFWWDNYGENKRMFGSGSLYAVNSNPSLVRRFRRLSDLTKLDQAGLLIDGGIYDLDWPPTAIKATPGPGTYFIPGAHDIRGSTASAFGFDNEVTEGRHPGRMINILFVDAHVSTFEGKAFQLRCAQPTATTTDPMWNPRY